ncbi:hypothetical protein WN55_06235, partial [Dufourea novaeangliae]
LVERWHRTLKAVIMFHEVSTWVEAHPTVFLGLRTCFKEDIETSTAELLYGTTLRIPGECFDEEETSTDPQIFVEKHRRFMRQLQSRPKTQHIKNVSFVFRDLCTCTHVYVCEDAVRRPLQSPYSGPFKILERLNTGGRRYTVLRRQLPLKD